MASTATIGHEFKAAMLAAIRTLVDPAQVFTSWGHPGVAGESWDDVIAVDEVVIDQDVATMGTNRSREETLRLTVWIASFRAGNNDDLEKVCADRAVELLRLIEHHVRQTDTTLGGVVRHCFLTGYRERGDAREALLADGRRVEIEATFTAHARVTGP
jgi:cobalamin-dependent methionine synthase I